MLGVLGLAGAHVDGVEVVLHGHTNLGAHVVVQLKRYKNCYKWFHYKKKTLKNKKNNSPNLT